MRLLFRERPRSFATGEDFHLAAMLRKHAGVRSYVLPVDAADRARWGDTEHRMAYNRYSTGGASTIKLRDAIWWHGLQHGTPLRWAAESPAPLGASVVLAVVDGAAQARHVTRAFSSSSSPSFSFSFSPFLLFCFSLRIPSSLRPP